MFRQIKAWEDNVSLGKTQRRYELTMQKKTMFCLIVDAVFATKNCRTKSTAPWLKMSHGLTSELAWWFPRLCRTTINKENIENQGLKIRLGCVVRSLARACQTPAFGVRCSAPFYDGFLFLAETAVPLGASIDMDNLSDASVRKIIGNTTKKRIPL